MTKRAQKLGLFGIFFFSNMGGGAGVFPIPKTFVNLFNYFWYAKFINDHIRSILSPKVNLILRHFRLLREKQEVL